MKYFVREIYKVVDSSGRGKVKDVKVGFCFKFF